MKHAVETTNGVSTARRNRKKEAVLQTHGPEELFLGKAKSWIANRSELCGKT